MSDASDVDLDDAILDGLKGAESRPHRRLAALVHAAARHTLASGAQVDASLNWYPLDGQGPLAPDVMVLPAGTLEPGARSYRQTELSDGPTPVVVVEVPSQSDGFLDLIARVRRYLSLGAAVYVASNDEASLSVYRWSPDGDEWRNWLGKPCQDLGGLVFRVDGDHLSVWLPSGITASDAADFIALAEQATERAEEQAARAERLAAQLRAAGIEPEI